MPDNVESPSGPIAPPSQVFNPYAGDHAPAPEPAPERDEAGRFLPKPQTLAPALRRKAIEVAGLEDADLAVMSAAEIRAEIRAAELNGRFEQQLQMARQVGGQTAAVTQPVAEPPADDFSMGIEGEEGYTEGLVPSVKKHLKTLADRIKALEAQLGGVTQFHEAQVRQQNESFGRRVEKLFAKHPHIFGEGTLQKLDKDSPELDFRMAAVKAYRKSGASPDELEETIERFVQERFGQRQPTPQADETDDDEQARLYAEGAGVLGRPTQRGNVPDPPSRERAVQGVQQLQRRMNGVPLPKTDIRSEFPTRG